MNRSGLPLHQKDNSPFLKSFIQHAPGGDFSEHILADLIAEGFSGEELLTEFKLRQAKVRPAVKAMLKDAKAAARGEGEYATYEEIFGAEE